LDISKTSGAVSSACMAKEIFKKEISRIMNELMNEFELLFTDRGSEAR
jgi:hypothetical protein